MDVAYQSLMIGAWAFLAAIAVWNYRQSKSQANEVRKKLDTAEKALEEARQRSDSALLALRTREEWFSNLLNSTRDIALVYAVTPDGKPGQFLQANNVACHVLGYTRDQLLGKTPFDIEVFAEPGQEGGGGEGEARSRVAVETLGRDNAFTSRFSQILLRRLQAEKQVIYEGRYVTQPGSLIPVEITACHVDIGEQPAIVCMAHDITERKKREIALQDKDKLLRDFMQKAPIGVALYDGQKKLSSVNPACLKMFGCPDRREFELFDLPDNPFLPEGAKETVQRGESVQCEAMVDFDEVVSQGLCATGRRGKGYFDLIINDLGMDDRFNPRGQLVLVQDITTRRETEEVLRQRERQLRQAQKMEAIGTLAGGIAHDFNNVLTPILGYADMALELCPVGDRTHEFLEEILSAARRARELVAQILAFSRQESGNQTPMHLIPIIKEVVKQRAAVLPASIQIQYVIKETQDLALANPTQIHQILTNLCKNAEHAVKANGGLIEVRLTSFVLTSLHRREFPILVTTDYLRQGARKRYLRISVRDTGCGMNPETMKRIFDTFFTTKKEGEGTGMGLAVVRGHVTSLGGAISVESTPGKGSVFHIALPLVEAPAEKIELTRTVVAGTRETILFVDDEVSVVRMASHMLESLGYETVVTSQSTKALEIFKQEADRFDVVITDHVMPEMTGIELAKEILKIRPETPVIMCTGFSEKISEEDAMRLGVRVYVTKPVERSELAAAIRRALGGRAPAPAASSLVGEPA